MEHWSREPQSDGITSRPLRHGRSTPHDPVWKYFPCRLTPAPIAGCQNCLWLKNKRRDGERSWIQMCNVSQGLIESVERYRLYGEDGKIGAWTLYPPLPRPWWLVTEPRWRNLLRCPFEKQTWSYQLVLPESMRSYQQSFMLWDVMTYKEMEGTKLLQSIDASNME